LQVKLLRVLQSRTFQRIGETQERTFRGKIIAATNRDLASEMRRRRFREDLYYRLCSDVIVTPSLREQLDDSPEAMPTLVSHIAARLVGEAEGAALAGEVLDWINTSLGSGYPWPGNVRELEQCVRNILVRKSYLVPRAPEPAATAPCQALGEAVAAGRLGAEELHEHYTALVHARAGSFQETARRLGVDHRTVKSRLKPELVERYREK
jgi:DNA-binding NtrC family response regulator